MPQDDVYFRRELFSLIVSQLRDCGFGQVATEVAMATTTFAHVENPPNRLLELVRKGLEAEKAGGERGGGGAAPPRDTSGGAASLNYSGRGGAPHQPPTSLNFSTKGPPKAFPRPQPKVVLDHKNAVRCARFSPDGRWLATGSADMSMRLVDLWKVRFEGEGPQEEPGGNPVTRQYSDHLQAVNDLDFHPSAPVLVSAAKDRMIRFFDFSRRGPGPFRVIQDTHSVRSLAFHPGGDFVLAGTDHPLAHLYNVSTFQCYLTAAVEDAHVGGPINQVRYADDGSLYVTASKDGGVRLWDGVSARCVRAMVGAHGAWEATSAAFTRDRRYVLSCGKDSMARLWDVGSGRVVQQYRGAAHNRTRCQAVFSHNEEFVLSICEVRNEVVVWDTVTGVDVSRFSTEHNAVPRWIAHSREEPLFVTCGVDRAVRLWRSRQ